MSDLPARVPTKDESIAAPLLEEHQREQARAPVRIVERPAQNPSQAWVRSLEEALAKLFGHLERRLDALEHALSTEKRIAALEARSTAMDAEAKFARGEPLVEREWTQLCERIRAPLRMDEWRPRHASWKGGR